MAARRAPVARLPVPPGRILDAARTLFAARGPEGVTMAEVAERAGVARATVFNQFGSKRALVEAITAEVLGRYVALLDHGLAERDLPVPALVRGLFEFMGRGIEEERQLYRGVFREIARHSLGLEEGGPGQVARQQAVARLVELLSHGQGRGDLSRAHRPEDLALAFDSLVFGTITHWLYDDASEPLHRRMRRAAEVFLSGAGAREREATAGAALARLRGRWQDTRRPRARG